MTKKEKRLSLLSNACRGNITAESALKELQEVQCYLPYPKAMRVELPSGHGYFVNYRNKRVWSAYGADGTTPGEYTRKVLTPYVEAEMAARRES